MGFEFRFSSLTLYVLNFCARLGLEVAFPRGSKPPQIVFYCFPFCSPRVENLKCVPKSIFSENRSGSITKHVVRVIFFFICTFLLRKITKLLLMETAKRDSYYFFQTIRNSLGDFFLLHFASCDQMQLQSRRTANRRNATLNWNWMDSVVMT